HRRAIRAARRLRRPQGLSVRQEDDPSPVLPAMRGGRVLARHHPQGRRDGRDQCPLPRRRRHRLAQADALRRPLAVGGRLASAAASCTGACATEKFTKTSPASGFVLRRLFFFTTNFPKRPTNFFATIARASTC